MSTIYVKYVAILPCEMQAFENDSKCAEITIMFYHIKNFSHVQSVIDIVTEFAKMSSGNLRTSS